MKRIFFYCTLKGKGIRLINDYSKYIDKINGKICVSAETEEVEKISYDCYRFETQTVKQNDLLKRSSLILDEFLNYHPRYAIHLSNVKIINPILLGDCGFRKYNFGDEILKRIPQNMTQAWIDGKPITIISIRPENLMNIIDGCKDIELRRGLTKDLKELIKND